MTCCAFLDGFLFYAYRYAVYDNFLCQFAYCRQAKAISDDWQLEELGSVGLSPGQAFRSSFQISVDTFGAGDSLDWDPARLHYATKLTLQN